MLNSGAELKLLTDGAGEVQICGVCEQPVHDAEDLVDLINQASARRATCATGVHDQSSRSHAVCRVHIRRADGRTGIFTMVDLAGTERGKDSQWHDKELQKETAEINSSLAALKDCVRERSQNAKHISFRKSKLTQILKSCFTRKDAYTVVIATVSPSSGVGRPRQPFIRAAPSLWGCFLLARATVRLTRIFFAATDAVIEFRTRSIRCRRCSTL
jgi:kinesin family protein 2/24